MDQYLIHPALGKPTFIYHSHIISFVVYTPTSYIVEIWTDLMPSREWVAVSTTSDPVQLPIHHATPNQIYFHVYRASINQTSTLAPGTYKFCVRIRHQYECEWISLGPEGDGRDGIIILH